MDLVLPHIRRMAGYVPGEQPQDGTYVKLNTNENPYPPSPRVLTALQAALTGDRLRKYPDPTGTLFRQTAAKLHGVRPDAILIGNGSDDILTMVTRAFVPQGGMVLSLTPSYVLYRSLAEIQGAHYRPVAYTSDWKLPRPWPEPKVHLTFIANPNSPSGTCVSAADLAEVDAPLVIDEAYVDFADAHCLELAARPNVVVTRSLSKAYSLAGIRFGYAVADPALIRELIKVKDSYNCDALSLVAAQAALEDQDYLRQTRAKILATRTHLAASLVQLGFSVTSSQANFVWCRRTDLPVRPIYEELKRRMILVRYMQYDGYGDGLRITVGTDAQIEQLLTELRQIV